MVCPCSSESILTTLASGSLNHVLGAVPMNSHLTTCALACGAVTLSLAAPRPATAQLDERLLVHASTAQVLEAGAVTLEPDDHRWITVRFDGREPTQYQVRQRDGQVCVEAVADQSASALALPISDHAAGDIEWSWWVDSLVAGSRLDTKSGDDYSARLLVNFAFDSSREGWFARLKHSFAGEQYGGEAPGSALSYVWSATDSVGATARSPYTNRVGIIVLDSGLDDLRMWRRHQRDLVEDYRAIFGKDPPAVTSVALFTDADDTRSSAAACYGRVRLEHARR